MTWLIVGLGNPGPKYAATRHNIGFAVVDELAVQIGARLARHKRAMALAAEGRFGAPGAGDSVVLVEPLSFMNESGGPVKALMGFYGVDVGQLIVIHDELDLPLGSNRIKLGGATTAIMGFGAFDPPSDPGTSSGCGWASAVRTDVKIPLTTCSLRSGPRSGLNFRSSPSVRGRRLNRWSLRALSGPSKHSTTNERTTDESFAGGSEMT